ncbi:MAG: DUF2017 domain-containing protein [Propioniciclava sp.]|uniref:DUF2017 domain-containing protein n=1 Tax=Propioniciclava sp. TaxID=2038686 RepID=UPI0039E2A701
MKPFVRDGAAFVARLDDFEVALVSSLVSQVAELIGDAGAPEASEDPFARWAREFSPAPLDRSDPVVARLFPDAYDDELAAAEHRRYSQDALRRARIDDSHLVLSDLDATGDGRFPLVVADDHVSAWMKTINGVRLSLSVRLGIESEDDHEELLALSARDPRTQLVSLYDWLGYVLESLIEAAGPSA